VGHGHGGERERRQFALGATLRRATTMAKERPQGQRVRHTVGARIEGGVALLGPCPHVFMGPHKLRLPPFGSLHRSPCCL
jgi:hypothetical protein